MTESPIKHAFSRVKEDIKVLDAKFELINSKLDQILQKRDPNKPNSNEFNEDKPQNVQIQQISSGNEGVQSINHSTITQQSLTQQSIKKNRR